MFKIRKVLYLAMIFVMVVSLAACNGATATPGTSQTESTESAEPTAPAEDQEVNFYTNMGSDPSIELLVTDFKDKTGIKLNIVTAPTVTDELKAKLTTMLASSSDTIDTMWIDELMAVTFAKAGYFEPIDDIMTTEILADFSPDVMEAISRSGENLYTIPMTTDAMFCWANKEMFTQAGKSIPTTLEELISTAQFFTKDGIYGFGASWAKGGYLYNDAIRYMVHFGGDFLDWSKQGSKDALQFMYDMIYEYKIVPEAAIGETYDVMNQKFSEGKYAMMTQWTYVATGLGDQFPDKLDVVPMPTYKTNKTLVAGWHVAMNKNAKNHDAAMKFMEYCATDGQKIWTKLLVKSTASKTALSDTSLYEELPMLKYTADYAKLDCFVPRPSIAKANELVDVSESIISAYLSKQITLDECVEQGVEQISALLEP